MTLRGARQADFAYQAVYRYMINLINEVSTDTRVKLPSLRELSQRLNVSISTLHYAVLLQIVNDYVNNLKNNLIPCG